MSHILSLDQGTTSSRAIVFDHHGSITAVAQNEFEQFFPKPGWVEHAPREIWSSQIGVATEAISQAGLKAQDIDAIGITNQRETTVVWERASGKPVYNAIVWQDRRTAEFCDSLKAAGHEKKFREKTGLVLDAYFSGTKVRWILDNVDGARKKADAGELCFGTVDSWLVWNLTGGSLHITDPSNASRTLLYDIHSGDWDDELLGILGVPRSMLPEVRSSSEVYAETSKDVFPHPIPVAGIAGDQQAALFGQRCTEPGMVKNTYGTGCFMLLNTGTEAVPSKNNLLTTVAWKIDGRTEYALEGSVFIAGAVVQWLRDGLKLIRSAPEVEALSATVEDNGGVYMVPAFAGLGAPHWDQYARGTIVGITRGTTAGHFARAALESIAYQVADVLDAMRADSGIDIKELRVDGGAAENDLLMQFQSDVLQAPTVRPKIFETTALGAAYLAGLAVGFWKDQAEVSKQWQADRRFEPEADAASIDALRADWRRALERSKAWAQ
ncbi:MAG: glycerol kinase GlpK [Gemmatimonadota bacterium]|nr:glycerol kinase GlpK [Gemmatimonadota bacterium]MDH3421714.1 glycerol kinase GlpK [Gemmatimonadota bacterium]